MAARRNEEARGAHRQLGGLVTVAAMLTACAQASSSTGPSGTDGGLLETCGNGEIDPGEQCDDGNDIDDDGCTRTCKAWLYRLPITFDADTAGTDVPVLVTLAPEGFGYARAAADGADLRLGTDDDVRNGFELPHWIEAWDPSGTSLVWARVPAVVAGTNTIWAFYGHSGAIATTSDFGQVFPDTLRITGNTPLGGAVSHDAVIVEAGHTVTVTAGAPLAITAAYVRVDGTIDADAAGHPSGMGPGPGGTSTNAGAGGGGHGGAGGTGGEDASDTPGAGGVAYGAPASETIDMGSGGGSTDIAAGGRGGGAVQIDAQRILLAGSITARGQNGPGAERSAGGGAGGGVLLRAASIAFTGSLSVDGGDGGSGASTVNDGGGGGGGGRIKLLHAGHLVDTGTTSLTGGAGGRFGNTSHGRPGAPGTEHVGTSSSLRPLPAIGTEEPL